MVSGERLLTVAEAAQVLDTSERFPRRLIAERRIRFVRLGEPGKRVAHLNRYVRPGDDVLVFAGIKGGPMRRSGFNKLTRWKYVAEALGVPNLHFHDLRHTGNTLAADMGVSTKT
ncbi:excisionase family DNA-binding protein [Spirillospora sp. CA-108201]